MRAVSYTHLEVYKRQVKALENIIFSASDETSIDSAITNYGSLSNAAKNVVTRIDTHTYSGSKREELRKTAEAAGENLWLSLIHIFVMLSVTAVFAAGVVIFMIYVNVAWTKHEAQEQLGALYSYLYFSNAWGTKRLRIWRAALEIYMRMSIPKKLIGV